MNKTQAIIAQPVFAEAVHVVVRDVEHAEVQVARTDLAVRHAAALKYRLAIGVVSTPGTAIA